MIDGLRMFTQKMGNAIGNNMSRLFGIENVALRVAEIYVDNNKRDVCSFSNYLDSTPWPLGEIVLENFNKVIFHFN